MPTPPPGRGSAAPPAIGGPAPPLQGAGLPRGRGGSGGAGAGAGERPGGGPSGPGPSGGEGGRAGLGTPGLARRGSQLGVGEQRGEQRCWAAGGGSRHPCQLGLIIAGLIIAEVSPWQRFSWKYTRAASPRLLQCCAHPSSSRAELFRERGCREPALRPGFFWGGRLQASGSAALHPFGSPKMNTEQ